MTTPDQATAKVKEIIEKIIKDFYEWQWKKPYLPQEVRIDQWLTTPEAKSLIDKIDGVDWISVEDRLPDIGDEYLVVYDLEDGDKPLCTAMQFDARSNKWYDERGAGAECKTVIKWKPLPPTN